MQVNVVANQGRPCDLIKVIIIITLEFDFEFEFELKKKKTAVN